MSIRERLENNRKLVEDANLANLDVQRIVRGLANHVRFSFSTAPCPSPLVKSGTGFIMYGQLRTIMRNHRIVDTDTSEQLIKILLDLGILLKPSGQPLSGYRIMPYNELKELCDDDEEN